MTLVTELRNEGQEILARQDKKTEEKTARRVAREESRKAKRIQKRAKKRKRLMSTAKRRVRRVLGKDLPVTLFECPQPCFWYAFCLQIDGVVLRFKANWKPFLFWDIRLEDDWSIAYVPENNQKPDFLLVSSITSPEKTFCKKNVAIALTRQPAEAFDAQAVIELYQLIPVSL